MWPAGVLCHNLWGSPSDLAPSPSARRRACCARLRCRARLSQMKFERWRRKILKLKFDEAGVFGRVWLRAPLPAAHMLVRGRRPKSALVSHAAFATTFQATLQGGLQEGLVYVEIPCPNHRTQTHVGYVLGSPGPVSPAFDRLLKQRKRESASLGFKAQHRGPAAPLSASPGVDLCEKKSDFFRPLISAILRCVAML